MQGILDHRSRSYSYLQCIYSDYEIFGVIRVNISNVFVVIMYFRLELHFRRI